ncbi:uncharacterized protein CLUP02_18007 [Colletotrichum lupini]|uniref:Uncharacterized protein n=1 Tax=Colletotrichum lupini TaxID=145971 RepID=A0A9Q8WAU5_9PEZI|nr:uncharacterized protein CLUP02_18007 [Colletotrichum lupini]UQC76494.1 hypothetical protein CLUP02_18007 [Colletotrichum lupini]
MTRCIVCLYFVLRGYAPFGPGPLPFFVNRDGNGVFNNSPFELQLAIGIPCVLWVTRCQLPLDGSVLNGPGVLTLDSSMARLPRARFISCLPRACEAVDGAGCKRRRRSISGRPPIISASYKPIAPQRKTIRHMHCSPNRRGSITRSGAVN